MSDTKLLQIRDWRTSKYPLRLILRAVFLTYMWSGMWQLLMTEEYWTLPKNDNKPNARGFEYLTFIGFCGSTLTMIVSSFHEFFPKIKGFKVGLNGLFLVVEVMITFLYWGLYHIDDRLILDQETKEKVGMPPIFMDTSAHLIPFIAMLAEFLFSRTAKRHLYENRAIHITAVVLFTFGYFAWIMYLFNDNNLFPYPFLRVISQPARIAFTVFSTFMGLFIYGIANYAYLKYHATEDDLPVIEEEFYDDIEE